MALLYNENQLYLFQSFSENLTVDELYKALFGRIDPRCIPSKVIFTNKIPTTLNGKTNFEVLRSLTKTSVDNKILKSENIDPRLLNIWQKHVGPLSLESDFNRSIYHYGKNSISSLSLLNDINKIFGVNISLGRFLARPTFLQLTKLVSHTEAISVNLRAQQEVFELSSFQKRMWLMNHIDQSSNIGLHEIIFKKNLSETEAKEIALQVFQHFEALRVKIKASDRPYISFDSKFEEFFSWNTETDLDNLAKAIQLDLSTSPAAICYAKPSGLVFVIHHIISDAASIDILIDYINAIVTGTNIKAPPSKYLNIAMDNDPNAIIYWKNRLRNYGYDHMKNEVSTAFEQMKWSYPDEVSKAIKIYCLENGISLHLFFFAAAHLSLSIIFDQLSFAHILSITKRRSTEEFQQFGCGIENLLFLFQNNVKENLNTYLKTFAAQWSEQLEHTDLSLTEQIKGQNLLDENGNLKVLHSFIFESESSLPLNFEIKTSQGSSGQGIPLVSNIRIQDGIFYGALQAFTGQELKSIHCQMFQSCMQLIPNLFIAQQELRLEDIGASVNLPSHIDHGLSLEIPNLQKRILDKFYSSKDSPAIYITNDNFITYQQLFEKVNDVSAYLIESTQQQDRILVQLNRGIDFVATSLAAILTGRCFIPLSSNDSPERLEKIKAVYNNHISVINSSVKGRKACTYEELSKIQIAQNQPIYTIFTSGTTGEPKGVEISYSSVANYLSWAADQYNFEEKSTTALFSSLSVDLTVTSYLLPFFCGGSVYIPQFNNDLESLKELISWKTNFHLLKMTPSHLRWLKLAGLSANIKTDKLILGGEKLNYSLLQNLPNVTEVYNEYGPTETTVGCTAYKVVLKDIPIDRSDDISIGRAVYNSSAHYGGLFSQFHPELPKVLLTMHGECCLLGYVTSLSEANKKSQGSYATGDLFKLGPDGPIYLSRNDQQAKVQGNRIDLTAIQSSLNQYSDSNWELHLVNTDWSTELFAVTTDSTSVPEEEKINTFLLKRFPKSWLPKKYFMSSELIINKSGKIDWTTVAAKKLPAKNEISLLSANFQGTALISEIWENILGRKHIPVNTNFFDAGGDSIRIFELFEALKPFAKTSFKLIDLFKYTTIEAQAVYLGLEQAPMKSPEFAQKTSQMNRLRLLQKGRKP